MRRSSLCATPESITATPTSQASQLRAAVAHRAAHDGELRGRVAAGACRSRWPSVEQGSVADWCACTGASTEMPSTSGSAGQLFEVLVLHLGEDAADQRQREAAAVLVLLGQLVEGLRAAQVDAGAGADDDAAPAAPLVRSAVDGTLQAPIELVEPGAARARATVTAPRLRRRDVRGDETGKQPNHRPRATGETSCPPVEHAACHPGRVSPTRSSHCAIAGYERRDRRCTRLPMIQERTADASRVGRRPRKRPCLRPVPGDPPELKRMSRSETRITSLEIDRRELRNANANGQARRPAHAAAATCRSWHLASRSLECLEVGGWSCSEARRVAYATSRPGTERRPTAAPGHARHEDRPRRGQLAARPAIAAAGLVLVHAVVGAGEQALVVLAVGRERRRSRR